MKKFSYFLVFILSTCLFVDTCQGGYFGEKPPKVVKGVIDLSSRDFKNDGIVNLDGEWEYYEGKSFGPDDFKHIDIVNKFGIVDEREFVTLPPGLWKVDETIDGKPFGDGVTTLRLKIKLNMSLNKNGDKPYAVKSLYFMMAGQLWIDGKHFNFNDKSMENQKTIIFQHSAPMALFYPEKPVTEIILQISDSYIKRIGFDRSIEFGLEDQIIQKSNNKFVCTLVFCVWILVMAIYQFRISRKGTLTIYFCSMCIMAIFLYMAPSERFFVMLFANFDWKIADKIEYAALYLGFTAFALFIMTMFSRESLKIMIRMSQGSGLLFTALMFVPDDLIYRYVTIAFQVVAAVYIGYLIYILVKSVSAGRNGAIWVLSSFIIFIGVMVNDLLYEQDVINTGGLVQYGCFGFIVLLSFPLVQRFLRFYKRLEAYERFVPVEFLRNLDKEDIIDVRLGDNAEKNMSILFSDIRNFTSLSEKMTPEENFKFINSYLCQMGPVIKKHRGFIDKFIGDAIMALFDTNADQAVKAAIGMVEQLGEYNKGRQRAGYVDLKIGVGVNTGALRIGTVGELHRMEATVISDAVNLASRVEGMTKVYGASILISDDTYNSLNDPSKYHMRELDQVKVKGREKPVTLWEVFDNDSPEMFDYKKEISSIFVSSNCSQRKQG